MDTSSEWTVIAHLLRPQGRKGEVLAELLTDFPGQFKERKRLFLVAPGFAGDTDASKPVEIIDFWLPTGKNEGRIVLQFAESSSIEEAEQIAGLDVVTSREDRIPLPEDASYISDLVGCTVFDHGSCIGTVHDVQFATSADGRRKLSDTAPLLAITPRVGGDDLLVPFVKGFLLSIDLVGKRIEMNLPDGLLDLNHSPSVVAGEAR
jgi:16S rRNA processing protein RimM